MAHSWITDAASPDDAAAQYAIQERLRMARALREQSMQGASLENVGGQLVGNPIARALTSGLQGFSAGRQEKRALGDASALAGQQRERLAAALAGAGGQKTPDDMIAFGTKLLADPATAEVGQFYVQAGQKAKQDAEAQARQEARWGRQDAAADRRFQQQETAAERRHREQMEARAAADAARLAALQARGAPHAPLPAASLQEVQYLRSLDPADGDSAEVLAAKQAKRDEFFQVKRAQQVLDRGGSQDVLQQGGAPGTVAASLPKTLPPDKTPEHAYNVAGAKVQGEGAAKQAAQRAKAPGYLAEAGELLSETAPQAPTGSGIGAVADSMAGWLGISPAGAKEADQLEMIGGHLTSLVPRFEGPQSDKDTAAYRTMAGNIGDRTIPVERRRATLKKLETLIMGYGGPEKVFSSAAPPPAAPPGAAGGLTPEEQAELDQLRQHFGKGAQQ